MIAMQRNDMGMVWEVQSVPYLTHINGKDTYFVKIHTIPIHGNDMGSGNGMGAYISPIPNPHLLERYIRSSYWGKLGYGGNSPISTQNYSRKRPLCD